MSEARLLLKSGNPGGEYENYMAMKPEPLWEAPNYAAQERRLKPRIYDDFAAKVRGVNVKRRRFVEHTIVENLSSSGLFMRLLEEVNLETRLLIVLHLLFPNEEHDSDLFIAISGSVVRAERLPDDSFGVAIRFNGHRFLSKDCSMEFFERLVINGDTFLH